MGSKLREKTTTGNHRVARGSPDTAMQEGISMDDPMRDKLNAVNTPIMVEDVMDVTHKEAATGENPKTIKLGRKAKNQGDYFNEKISEIDSELRKFELEKDSTYDLVLIVETDITQDGKSENCGIMPNKSHHELAAWEDLNVQGQHVTNTEGNPIDYVPHVTGEKKKKNKVSGKHAWGGCKHKFYVEEDSAKRNKNPTCGSSFENIETHRYYIV